jgi:hypothetical protein
MWIAISVQGARLHSGDDRAWALVFVIAACGAANDGSRHKCYKYEAEKDDAAEHD